jgi:hypothetical protein
MAPTGAAHYVTFTSDYLTLALSVYGEGRGEVKVSLRLLGRRWRRERHLGDDLRFRGHFIVRRRLKAIELR